MTATARTHCPVGTAPDSSPGAQRPL